MYTCIVSQCSGVCFQRAAKKRPQFACKSGDAFFVGQTVQRHSPKREPRPQFSTRFLAACFWLLSTAFSCAASSLTSSQSASMSSLSSSLLDPSSYTPEIRLGVLSL